MTTNEANTSKANTKLETTRTLCPQWKGAGKDGTNGNLGEFQVKTITPSISEFCAIAQEFPDAVQEFLAGQLHIRFSGASLLARVKAELEAQVGKPEKGKSADWYIEHAPAAKALADKASKDTIDFGHELREWAREWKPEGAITSKVDAVKLAAASALADALGITLEQAQAMLASKLAK